MCGISGLFTQGRLDKALVGRMIKALAHRGPDAEAVWLDQAAGIGFGHRRLSILDLSPAGAQPMHSAEGRLVLNFNGEIYNHLELRAALEAEQAIPEGGWRGHSDTEVFLQGIAHWGLEQALERSVGMFAFALWDRKDRTLRLVRDRFGEKPLYYGWCGGDLVFGSELKALRTHPGFNHGIDRDALRLLASRAYIPAPLSIYRGIFKLPPAAILTLDAQGLASPLSAPPSEGAAGGVTLQYYWSYRETVEAGLLEPITDERQAIDELERVLGRAITEQSAADVPVGAFLSGGIDSSAIIALYQQHSQRPVSTFTIGFEDRAYNEAPFARAVAEQLGTIHQEQILTEADALAVIPLLPAMYDEPFADSSQIPTFLVSRAARSKVTVALTGDGGDELFGGYNRHINGPRLRRRLSRIPRPLRAMAEPLSRLPTAWFDRAGRLLPRHGSAGLGARIQKGLQVSASARSLEDIYGSFVDQSGFATSPVLGCSGEPPALDLNVGAGAPPAVRMMYSDATSYLPDDILCKVDRASMACSLETRVPFLDHRVAQVAAQIPIEQKISGGQGKKILRKLLYRHLSPSLFDRPKAGFAIPLGTWLRGPLREWAEDLLQPSRMAEEGWFHQAIVRDRWSDHLVGRRDATQALWPILMFQAWLRGNPL
jgi:asparagine synthase (glutamine-hydrolysing)